ncbi:hypothetical protein EDD66_11060 [Mobilisporobacter senegalensis]|uniref:Uncharacterized protein n=1 Tax=Mobilisporobacter senegalensis TaxID=1329262 RepID=A0A3N1XG64_9FIRM|nr:hypothetical protein [Mobilisporobacter senegalensis]ROR25704.1 hypothetical protein EDD66_11060 [Mobilisporobacter senegalensis]
MLIRETIAHQKRDENYYKGNIEEMIWAQDLGISFVIDNRTCSYVNDYHFICNILSDDSYMRDYIPDEQGKIIQIRLDKVSNY